MIRVAVVPASIHLAELEMMGLPDIPSAPDDAESARELVALAYAEVADDVLDTVFGFAAVLNASIGLGHSLMQSEIVVGSPPNVSVCFGIAAMNKYLRDTFPDTASAFDVHSQLESYLAAVDTVGPQEYLVAGLLAGSIACSDPALLLEITW